MLGCGYPRQPPRYTCGIRWHGVWAKDILLQGLGYPRQPPMYTCGIRFDMGLEPRISFSRDSAILDNPPCIHAGYDLTWGWSQGYPSSSAWVFLPFSSFLHSFFLWWFGTKYWYFKEILKCLLKQFCFNVIFNFHENPLFFQSVLALTDFLISSRKCVIRLNSGRQQRLDFNDLFVNCLHKLVRKKIKM